MKNHRTRYSKVIVVWNVLIILVCGALAILLTSGQVIGMHVSQRGVACAALALALVSATINVALQYSTKGGKKPELRHEGFSKREHEVIGLISKGYSNRKVAEELNISLHTVKKHVYNIFRKAGVSNRIELLCYCREAVQ